jgi:hypothetical protein
VLVPITCPASLIPTPLAAASAECAEVGHRSVLPEEGVIAARVGRAADDLALLVERLSRADRSTEGAEIGELAAVPEDCVVVGLVRVGALACDVAVVCDRVRLRPAAESRQLAHPASLQTNARCCPLRPLLQPITTPLALMYAASLLTLNGAGSVPRSWIDHRGAAAPAFPIGRSSAADAATIAARLTPRP